MIKSLIKDSLSNHLVLILRMLLGLLAVPLYISAFGLYEYGLFLIAVEIPYLLLNFDFGTSKSIIRYVSEYRSKKLDQNNELIKFQNLISANITLTIYISALLTMFIYLLGIVSPYIYGINSEYVNTLRTLFYIVTASSVIIFISEIPKAILSGMSLFYKRNKYQLIVIFYQFLILFLLYKKNIDLIHYTILFSLTPLISLLIDSILVYKLNGLKLITLRLVKINKIRESGILKYNLSLLKLTIVSLFSSYLDKQIIAILLGPKEVSIYVIIVKLSTLIKRFISSINEVLRPRLVKSWLDLDIMNDARFYFYIQILSISLLFSSFLAYFYWENLSYLWLKDYIYADYNIWVSLTIVNLALQSFTTLYINYMVINDEFHNLISIELKTVFFNLLVSLLMIYKIGLVGAIIGSTIQMIFNIVLIYRTCIKNNLISLDILFTKIYLLSILIICISFFLSKYYNNTIFLLILIPLFSYKFYFKTKKLFI